MREPAFRKQNLERWKALEENFFSGKGNNPDSLAEQYIQLTDDLAYARTYYPNSKTVEYLNNLAARAHQNLYENKREKRGRFLSFFTEELPDVYYKRRKELLISFLVFLGSALIGVVSSQLDPEFVRVILGDSYVNMTLENIDKEDPLAVYKSMDQGFMSTYIGLNNIKVSLMCFAFGAFSALGTIWILIQNGVMLGAFQYFFYQEGLLLTSFLGIWIHGTIEISAIVVAGAAGIVFGNGFFFPGTFPRMHSLREGAKDGIKMVIGLVPLFVLAALLEGYVTRHYQYSPLLNAAIILFSATLVIFLFVYYPYYRNKYLKIHE
ncbi:stage II sporulation protein M [Chitinophagales bacterium]|nr:stage II sporulation protein M [Chitinophagales bacterium]